MTGADSPEADIIHVAEEKGAKVRSFVPVKLLVVPASRAAMTEGLSASPVLAVIAMGANVVFIGLGSL